MGVCIPLWLFLVSPILFLTLTLLILHGKIEVTAYEKEHDYERCFKMNEHLPGCEATEPAPPPEDGSAPPPVSPHECYTTRSEPTWINKDYKPLTDKEPHLPFACHMAPCSIQNEAFWLGMYPREDFEHFLVKPPTKYFQELPEPPKGTYEAVSEFYDKRSIRRDYIKTLSTYWRQFKQMHTDENKQIPDDAVERTPLPDYVDKKVTLYKPDGTTTNLDNDADPAPTVVPLICDPRAYLVCDHSYEVAELYRTRLNTVPTVENPESYPLTGRCNCHPLYSKQGDDAQSNANTKNKLPVVRWCLARPHVPCEFARYVTKTGAYFLYNLTDLPPPGYKDGAAVGYTTIMPASDDPLAPFIVPDDFQDNTDDPNESDPAKKIKFMSTNSRCIPEASCEYFPNATVLASFRRGEMWQGFGFHPIVRDMMLQSATKICQCKDREKWKHSGMHDCIKEEG